MPIPSEPTDPSHDPSLAEQTMTPKETTTGQIEASIPSTQTSIAEPSHHLHMILPPPYDHLSIFFSVFLYFSRTCNPMFLMFYRLGLDVLLVFAP